MKPELKFAQTIFNFVDDLTTSAMLSEDEFTYIYVPQLEEFKTLTELRQLASASKRSIRAQQVQTPNSVVLASTLGLDPSTGSRPRIECKTFSHQRQTFAINIAQNSYANIQKSQLVLPTRDESCYLSEVGRYHSTFATSGKSFALALWLYDCGIQSYLFQKARKVFVYLWWR